MEEVESESKHVWKLIKDILLLPITLIMALLGKKSFGELFSPIKDVWDFFWDAKVVAVLILLNVGAFALFIVDDITGNEITGISSEEARIEFGLKYLAAGPKSIKEGNFIPFFASWFMHAGIAHLLGNMLALFILGRVVEKNFGALKTVSIYFVSAAIASIADIAVHFNQMDYFVIGASGAISGIAAAAILVQPFYLTYLFVGIPLPVFIIGWLQIIGDVTGVLNPDPKNSIAHISHLGGYLAITAIAFFLSGEDKSKLKKGLIINLITLAAAALVWWFFFRTPKL